MISEHLTPLPALIDPHVHFRVPGAEYKEDWKTGAQAAIAGGYTTVFDMPNTNPPTTTLERLVDKKKIIDEQLKEAGIPLRYQLFFGADRDHLHEIEKVKDQIIGVKVFMGCSTGGLLIEDDESLHQVFELCAKYHLMVAVHAEDEASIKTNKTKFKNEKDYATHSKIRNAEVAAIAVEKSISLTKKYGTKLYLLHMSCEEELSLIKKAKQEKLPVYAETTPHHLFLNHHAYKALHGKAVMNPPLRLEKDQTALWEAISEGVIDTVGSDHAPHLLTEKEKPYGECPSGVPGIETTLPLLLNAHHQGYLSLEKIISLTSSRAREIFNLSANEDKVFVDLNEERVVNRNTLKTKCGWSPFEGWRLKGWPVYTVLENKIYQYDFF